MKRKSLDFIMTIFGISVILSVSCEKSSPVEEEVFVSGLDFEYVLYDNLRQKQTGSIRDKLEKNAERIASHLNVELSDKFRVHIWGIYDNYLAAQVKHMGVSYPGSTGWVMGPNDLAIFFTSDAAETAEHEFAHCITLHLTQNENIPRVLWEAVAVYEADEFIDPTTIDCMVSGDYPSIDELNGDFNDGNYKVYEVGYLLIEYLLSEWGHDAYIDLIKSLGDIDQVLGISVSEFENGWYEFIETRYFG